MRYGKFGLDIQLARENQNRKKEKSNTRASENRLYRSRIAGNFDTAKSQGATTARTRADESSLLGLHGHQGDLEEMERTKTHQSKNRKLKEKKGNRKPTKTKKNRKQEIHQKIITEMGKKEDRKPTKKWEIHQKRRVTGSHQKPTNQDPKTHQSKNRKPKEK